MKKIIKASFKNRNLIIEDENYNIVNICINGDIVSEPNIINGNQLVSIIIDFDKTLNDWYVFTYNSDGELVDQRTIKKIKNNQISEKSSVETIKEESKEEIKEEFKEVIKNNAEPPKPESLWSGPKTITEEQGVIITQIFYGVIYIFLCLLIYAISDWKFNFFYVAALVINYMLIYSQFKKSTFLWTTNAFLAALGILIPIIKLF